MTNGFRPEIEGLRALAIVSVLVFHAGVPGARGGFIGVDVFFVISGFLITQHILREVEATGRLDLLSFWSRRMKRLLPAALTVLLVTAVAVRLIMPNTAWRSIGADIVAASTYLVNWRFAFGAVDYNAEGTGASPVQHFWSLSVEEQFYILWPIALAGAVWLFCRGRKQPRVRAVVGVVIASIVIPSFAWSIVATAASQNSAFFVTTTRLWELGVGAAVAIGTPFWSRLPRAVATLLGWLGAVAVVAAVVLFDGRIPWPGSAALLPVLGTAAVILSTTGRDVPVASVGRWFALPPLVWVGALSYSWYLWHWPVLILAEAQFGELSWRWGLLLAAMSGVPAWLSLKLIENPIRRAKSLATNTKLSFSLGANFSAAGIVVGLLLMLIVPGATQSQASAPVDEIGAAELTVAPDGTVEPYAASDETDGITPLPADATRDLPQAQTDECLASMEDSTVVTCEYGDPEGGFEVALVGDSKLLQWQPAISDIAERRGWRVSTYLKSACAFSEPDYGLTDARRSSCAEWNFAALDAVVDAAPDAVITSGRQVYDGTTEDGDAGPGGAMIASWWSELEHAGIAVVPLLDNPSPSEEVYECIAEHPAEATACGFEREGALRKSGAKFQLAAAEITGNTNVVDIADITCPPGERCPAIIGDVLVYRQGSHLTDTFIRSAIPLLDARLAPAVAEAVGATDPGR